MRFWSRSTQRRASGTCARMRVQVRSELRRCNGQELEQLRRSLFDLLRQGFVPTLQEMRAGEPFPLMETAPSLKHGLVRPPRPSIGKLSQATTEERRAYEGPGIYVELVEGPLRELMPYLVRRLLTMPGMAAVERCPAPAPKDLQDAVTDSSACLVRVAHECSARWLAGCATTPRKRKEGAGCKWSGTLPITAKASA